MRTYSKDNISLFKNSKQRLRFLVFNLLTELMDHAGKAEFLEMTKKKPDIKRLNFLYGLLKDTHRILSDADSLKDTKRMKDIMSTYFPLLWKLKEERLNLQWKCFLLMTAVWKSILEN